MFDNIYFLINNFNYQKNLSKTEKIILNILFIVVFLINIINIMKLAISLSNKNKLNKKYILDKIY